MRMSVAPQQIYACKFSLLKFSLWQFCLNFGFGHKGALGMEAEKRVIAHLESSSATLVTMNGDTVAIPGKNPQEFFSPVIYDKIFLLQQWRHGL